MAHRDGAALLIDEAVFPVRDAGRGDCDRRKGFVDLPNVDVVRVNPTRSRSFCAAIAGVRLCTASPSAMVACSTIVASGS